ncbi:hypothetical protein HPP92_025071 [Vanilla planifolia]|uniref:4-coumarate--CoA ligase n=1 Tax=Vanilla planifolia TaxID=51239 RepID=A0A835PLJ7_VANPL|nr:hypothetical protein HPP92_025071 [Vanilla planifolia]
MAEITGSGFSPSTGIYKNTFSSPPKTNHPPLPLPHFLLSPLRHPSKPAFIDAASGESLSYSDLLSLTAATANALSASGVRRGDVVLLVSPNSIHYPALALGIMTAGAVFSTANHLLTRRELLSQIEDSRPVLVLTTADLRPKLESLTPRPTVLIDRLLSAPIAPASLAPAAAIDHGDAAALMYSSGTTGRSKGVVCTHRNLVSMAAVLRHVWGGGGGEEEIYLCVVPLFHMFGFSVFVCGAIAAGATVVVMQRYSLEGVLAAVEHRRVTRMPAVPPMVVQMVRNRHMARDYELGSLREVICSGAPLAREHMLRFAACYPDIVLSQCYGLTEGSGPLTLCDGLQGKFHASIGRLIPFIEAKIVDVKSGESLPPSKPGELCVRGPPVMQGYLNNPEATSLAIDNQGWLHTGDLCYVDARGLFYVVGRIKELIKYKAYQVAPAELEELLSTHPGIEDVAVISHPDEEAGEIPMACVVRKAGFEMKQEDVTAFLEGKVAPYKKIRKVMFVEFIPRSPSGKIIRRLIKEKDVNHHRRPAISRI